MTEHGAPNPTNKAGHAETNKVAGEGETLSSQAETVSGGAAATAGKGDPDAAPEIDAEGRGGPSMTAPAAGVPSRSATAPGTPR